jgi:hypothetical protein
VLRLLSLASHTRHDPTASLPPALTNHSQAFTLSAMSYPASVEQVTSSRLRQKQAKIRRPQAEGDEAQYDDEVDVGVGIGGPILDFGREGGVRLESGKGGWKWTWVNQKGNEDSLIASEGVLLYPGCRDRDVELDDVPASKIADSAVSPLLL